MNTLKKFLAIGPGGMKCGCCFPPRGKRKAEFRKAKRKEETEVKKEINEESNALLLGEYAFPELWDD